MTLLTYLELSVAAIGGGAVNAIAGGGTLFTFPALLAVLPPMIANASSTVALLPGSMAGAWGFRAELHHSRHMLKILLLPSFLGGLLGAMLMTRLPSQYFDRLVPWLILSASLLFLIQPLVSRLLTEPSPGPVAEPTLLKLSLVVIMQFLVGLYGGYFGAGIGILMLSSLALMGLRDIHQMNALKNILASCINGISVLVFALEDRVAWNFASVMALASIAGGYLGARFSKKLNKNLIRWLVISVGFYMSYKLFMKVA